MDFIKESFFQVYVVAEIFFLKVFDLFEEMKYVKNRFKEVTEIEMKSKILMDD